MSEITFRFDAISIDDESYNLFNRIYNLAFELVNHDMRLPRSIVADIVRNHMKERYDAELVTMQKGNFLFSVTFHSMEDYHLFLLETADITL